MFFRNLMLYRLTNGWPINAESTNECFSRAAFQACGSSDLLSSGWVPPRKNSDLVLTIGQQYLIAYKEEEKILPGAVVRRFTDERVRHIEEEHGRKVGRKEKRELKEQVTTDLLPRAFTAEKTTYAWIDPVNRIIAIDTPSKSRAENLLEALRKSISPLPAIKGFAFIASPSSGMNNWIASGEAPIGFSLDQDLELRSAEQAKVRYTKHTLEGDEIRQHIANGKIATKLALTWQDKISFTLTDDFLLKQLSFLDILTEKATEAQTENEDERFDIDFTIMSGELPLLFTDLIDALGGERPPEESC